jgi:hypothetical protein
MKYMDQQIDGLTDSSSLRCVQFMQFSQKKIIKITVSSSKPSLLIPTCHFRKLLLNQVIRLLGWGNLLIVFDVSTADVIT